MNGRGRLKGNKPGSGPGGSCKCPNCGATKKHETGNPCYNQKCPKCGTTMVKQ